MTKMQKLQQQCKDDYGLNIDIYRLSRLKGFVIEAKKIYSVLSNVKKGEYGEYIKQYKIVKLHAEKLGATVSEPLRKPMEIKYDISEIFTQCGFTDKFNRDKMLEWMGLSDNIENLPRIKLSSQDQSDYDDWSNYSPTEEEESQYQQSCEDYYNFQK